MSKTKLIILSLLITIALAPYAYAGTESFILASSIVKSFDKETKALLPENLDKGQTSAFTKGSKKNTKETLSRIKSLRRSEGPSPKRFSRLFRIVDTHIKNHIKEVDKLAATLKGPGKAEVEDMGVKFGIMRKELLEELKTTSFSERKPTDWNRVEPVIDRSPYEERPDESRGLYER